MSRGSNRARVGATDIQDLHERVGALEREIGHLRVRLGALEAADAGIEAKGEMEKIEGEVARIETAAVAQQIEADVRQRPSGWKQRRHIIHEPDPRGRQGYTPPDLRGHVVGPRRSGTSERRWRCLRPRTARRRRRPAQCQRDVARQRQCRHGVADPVRPRPAPPSATPVRAHVGPVAQSSLAGGHRLPPPATPANDPTARAQPRDQLRVLLFTNRPGAAAREIRRGAPGLSATAQRPPRTPARADSRSLCRCPPAS